MRRPQCEAGAFKRGTRHARSIGDVACLPEEERDGALREIGCFALLDQLEDLMSSWHRLDRDLAFEAALDVVPWAGVAVTALKWSC